MPYRRSSDPNSDDVIVTQSTSLRTSRVLKDYQLDVDDSGTTRKVLRGLLIENHRAPSESLKITIVHQRRSPKADTWTDIESAPLSKVHAGEIAKLNLSASETMALTVALQELWALASEGPRSGINAVKVIPADQTAVPSESVEAIRKLLRDLGKEDFVTAIAGSDPDLLDTIALRQTHAARRHAIDEFEQNLNSNDWKEPQWQSFLEKHEWILGFGAAYQYLHRVADQPTLGDPTYEGRGANRGDFLRASAAMSARFTVVVEIKTPRTPLLQRAAAPYRKGTFGPGTEIAAALVQVQTQCLKWEEKSHSGDAVRDLEPKGIFTFRPRGILVAGDTRQLESVEAKRSFEVFRRSLSNPEILTFDELLMRAKMMLA